MTGTTSNPSHDVITQEFEKWWLSLPEDLQKMYGQDGLLASERAFRAGRQPVWNPIESAPEGTLTLFYDANATEVRTCMFVDWLANGRFCLDGKRSATHWLSLHAPTHPPKC